MRLIDADHTEKVFCEIMNLPHNYCGPSDIKISIDAVFSVLGQVPDADPVKHGRWIFAKDVYVSCSVCGVTILLFNAENPNYCPHCGAKMDGKEE